MNELDAIQQQMMDLWIDVSPSQQAVPTYDDTAMLSPEEEAMFQPGWAYGEPMPQEAMPQEMAMPEQTGLEQIQSTIAPMIQWMPKEQFADLIIWMAQQQSFNQQL